MEAAKELLDQGADVNCENARGSTPLHFAAAAKSRSRDMCELLLDAGADTGFSDLQASVRAECGSSGVGLGWLRWLQLVVWLWKFGLAFFIHTNCQGAAFSDLPAPSLPTLLCRGACRLRWQRAMRSGGGCQQCTYI